MLRDENKNGKMDRNELFTFTKDHLGSIREVMDQKQDVIQRYSYSSYGKTKLEKIAKDRSTVVDVPYGYTSREWEKETGDYFYRARYYDPETGRFLSEDPIGFAGKDYNLYRYVRGNVLKSIDSTGKATYGIGLYTGGGFMGGGVTSDHQIVVDDGWNIGIATTVCVGGVSDVASASAGGVISAGDARTIFDLSGQSTTAGLAMSLPTGVSPTGGGGYAKGKDSCGKRTNTYSTTIGVTAGVVPVDISASVCKTTVISIFD